MKALFHFLILPVLLALASPFPGADTDLQSRQDLPDPSGRKASKPEDFNRRELYRGPCKPITVIYARGSNTQGNVGDDISPSIFDSLTRLLGGDSLAIQGVDMPSGIDEVLANAPAGRRKTAQIFHDAVRKCPKTKVVLIGYSLGAQCVHNALNGLIKEEEYKDVAAVITMGKPAFTGDHATKLGDKALIYCYENDEVCEWPGLIVKEPHTRYWKEANKIAWFIKRTLKV